MWDSILICFCLCQNRIYLFERRLILSRFLLFGEKSLLNSSKTMQSYLNWQVSPTTVCCWQYVVSCNFNIILKSIFKQKQENHGSFLKRKCSTIIAGYYIKLSHFLFLSIWMIPFFNISHFWRITNFFYIHIFPFLNRFGHFLPTWWNTFS